MRAQSVWKRVERTENNLKIECPQLELAALNNRIDELEERHPERSKVEALKTTAIMLSREIDELRCSNAADDLTGLLAK
jgi:hypothetical protein